MRSRSWVSVLVGGVLAATSVIAISSGSAATTTKPYSATFAPSSVPAGASAVHVTLTITNNADPQSLGSVNVTAPAGFTITSAVFTPASTPGTIDLSGLPSLIKLRNLNLLPAGTLSVDITLDVPCAGGNTWGITAKQSNDFNGPPGNDFKLESPLVLNISGGCTLAWGTQPATTKINTTITGAPYNAAGSNVTVRAVDGANQTITTINGPTVTLNQSAGSGGTFTGTTANLVNGVATFTNFKSSTTGSNFVFKGSANGFTDTPNSAPFFITLTGEACTGSGCPTFSTPLLNNSSVDSSAAGSFSFLGITDSALPSPLPQGCANYKGSVGGAFEAIDGRGTDQGELRFTYYIDKKRIEKLYGKNSGQQFIPLCAGAAWRDSSGSVRRCDDPGAPDPWKGVELDSNGLFTGVTKDSDCDAGTGLYWGIIGSFQSYNVENPVDPNSDPSVTSWDSNATFRFFNVKVPAPWDWKFG